MSGKPHDAMVMWLAVCLTDNGAEARAGTRGLWPVLSGAEQAGVLEAAHECVDQAITALVKAQDGQPADTPPLA